MNLLPATGEARAAWFAAAGLTAEEAAAVESWATTGSAEDRATAARGLGRLCRREALEGDLRRGAYLHACAVGLAAEEVAGTRRFECLDPESLHRALELAGLVNFQARASLRRHGLGVWLWAWSERLAWHCRWTLPQGLALAWRGCVLRVELLGWEVLRGLRILFRI